MTAKEFRQKIKVWILPIAMLCGVLFHDAINALQFLAPYLLVAMLLIAFCRIEPSKFRLSALTWSIVGVQLVGCIVIYFALLPFGDDMAQGAMICVLCPTATAAPVITAMLGGSISTLVAISVLSNLVAAILAPILFTLVCSPDAAQPFLATFATIIAKVAPMIVGPLLVALLIRRYTPEVHRTIANIQGLSFYLWAVTLILVVGKTVSYAMATPVERILDMIFLALIAAALCAMQFYVGRKLGQRFGDKIAGAQGLGQKNTVLAIWMASNFLNPLTAIAPAAYIAWQNIFNSLQLIIKDRKDTKAIAKK